MSLWVFCFQKSSNYKGKTKNYKTPFYRRGYPTSSLWNKASAELLLLNILAIFQQKLSRKFFFSKIADQQIAILLGKI